MHLKQQSNVQVDIYDLQGRMVKNIYNGTLTGGLKNLNADVSNIQQGLYFVIVQADSQRSVQKLMIQ